jgi:cytochrome oxidase Cu insertion factor (SCO1/SenC/PrrC family)
MTRIFFFACAIALFSAVNGCSSRQDQSDAQNESSMTPKASAVGNVAEVINVSTRPDFAPNFSWKDKTGKVVDLDSYRGRVTLINF